MILGVAPSATGIMLVNNALLLPLFSLIHRPTIHLSDIPFYPRIFKPIDAALCHTLSLYTGIYK